MNLSGTYKADDWVTLDANIRIDIGDSYWVVRNPFSISSEFFPSTKAPIYLGMSFGGENSFVWGTGISLKMGSVIFDVRVVSWVVYLMMLLECNLDLD